MDEMMVFSGRSAARRRPIKSNLTLVEITVLGLAALLLFAAAAAPRFGKREELAVTTVRVQATDTLWVIAKRYPVPGKGTDETVRTIREMNGLARSSVAEGQVLRVPDTAAARLASR